MNKKILFLLSHQPHPRFIKQINYLSKNNDISVIFYARDTIADLEAEYDQNCILNYNLGTIPNGKYIQRAVYYIKSFKKLKRILDHNYYDKVIINNIDTLGIFKLCRSWKSKNPQIIMEISDLRSHTYNNSPRSKILRLFERLMFSLVDKLIVTSPKFYEMYYCKLYKGEVFLLENKPLRSILPKKIDKIKNTKTVIGIVGQLQQIKPYKTLINQMKGNENYQIYIYGKGIYQDIIEEYAQNYENIKYFGAYNFFKDISQIYASIDILYMPYDTTNGSLNNKVALPNKLYEGMYYKVPIITSKNTYLGDIVDKYNIGMTIDCCKEDIIIQSIDEVVRNYDTYLKNLEHLDSNLYLGDQDYIRLEKYLNSND